jgi:hypothetical protein
MDDHDMFVTRVVKGRIFEYHVPDTILPVLPPGAATWFTELDRRLAPDIDETTFLRLIAPVVLRPTRLRTGDIERMERAFHGLRSARRVAPGDLLAANNVLVGASHPSFRTGSSWVGAPRPDIAWSVGAPADMVPALVARILDATSRQGSPSYGALVAMVRLLQVHPFDDGNGRTARLHAAAHIHRRIGPSRALCSLLLALRDRSRFDWNSIYASLRQTENWSTLLECWALAAASLPAGHVDPGESQ